MNNGGRIKFSEFQASIASFDLAEAESMVAEQFTSEGKLLKGGAPGQHSVLYGVFSASEPHPIVKFDFVETIDTLFNKGLPFDWVEFTESVPKELLPIDWFERLTKNTESLPEKRLPTDWVGHGPGRIEYVDYTHYLSELQAADEEQLGSIILDGAMNSVDAFYFWHAKLAVWIEDHSDAFINDMEDTIIALIEFYCVDCDPEMWHYHSADFILWLIDASGMQANPELQEKLLRLAWDHFSSWAGGPSPGEAELFAPKAKWEIVENLLDSKYSVTTEQGAVSTNNLQADCVVKGSAVTANTEHSVRLQKLIELQHTRDMDRRMRALQELPALADFMDAEVAQLATCTSCINFVNASLRLTGQLEERYLKQFLLFLYTHKATCLHRVQEVVLSDSDYNSDAERLMQTIRQHDQRLAMLESLNKLKRSYLHLDTD